MFNLITSIIRILKFFLNPNLIFFIFKNKNFFKHYYTPTTNQTLLCEVNGMISQSLAQNFLVLSICKDKNLTPYGFFVETLFLNSRFEIIKKYISLSRFLIIYKTFGFKKFFFLKKNINDSKKINTIANKIQNNDDILNLTIDNIYIGDLIYDSLLRELNIPSIFNIDKNIKKKIIIYLNYFFRIKSIIQSNNVKCFVSHTSVYYNAIGSRISLSMNIDTYVVLSTTIFKLSKSQMYAFHQTFRYKDLFSILSKKLNKDLYKIAKRRIEKKLSGGIVNEMFIKKTNFGSYKVNRLIRKTDNIKILIASHNFYDAIHHRGLLLFPDYYQWLIYLFKYSKNTNYDWYIKTHIDEDKSTEEIIKKLLDNNKHITLLPSDSSHHQLIQEGIDFCLTVDGTIGLEYAYLNKKVINASINNVHMSYNFNFNPSSFDDYSILLNNLKKLKLEINKDEILEFYYMHYIYNTNNWFFKKYNDFLDDNKGYFGQFNIDAIKYFNKNFNLNRKKQIIKLLNDFIQSKDYSLYEFIIKNKNKKEIENLLDVDNQFQNVE